MKYPALNISEKSWKGKELELDAFILFDEHNYNTNTKIFEKYFLDKKICDSNGKIHMIIGRTLPKSIWRRFFSFIPNVYKCEYITKKTNEEFTLEELRHYLIERISDLEQDNESQDWITDVLNAKTYAELMTN